MLRVADCCACCWFAKDRVQRIGRGDLAHVSEDKAFDPALVVFGTILVHSGTHSVPIRFANFLIELNYPHSGSKSKMTPGRAD